MNETLGLGDHYNAGDYYEDENTEPETFKCMQCQKNMGTNYGTLVKNDVPHWNNHFWACDDCAKELEV